MKFGMHLSAEAPPGTGLDQQLDEIVEQTRLAREVGFDTVGMGQHYLLDSPMPQPIPTLGRLAAETDGEMGLFTGVLLLPYHHPLEIAEQVSTLSYLTGSFHLGVGAGYVDHEFENFGIPKSERMGRLTESVEILNRLWTEDDVTYDGEFYSLENATINPKPETKPEIWCGAHAPRAVRRAGRIGDRWITVPQNTLSELCERKPVYEEARAERDGDASIVVLREAYVAPTREEAFDIATESFQQKYRRYLRMALNESSLEITEESVVSRAGFEEYAKDRFLIGSPEELCAEIDRYDEALDVSHFIVRLRRPTMAHEHACDAIELFGDEVIPNV